MQQNNTFIGYVSKEPLVTEVGKDSKTVVKLNVMTNEYVGKDKEDRIVSLQFTAFGNVANALKNVGVGDQLIIKWRIENNNFKKNGETKFSYNFIIEDFIFGKSKSKNK